MDFFLYPNQPLDKDLRRIAQTLLDEAVEQLELSPDRAEAVHEARKAIKKMRALLRLIELPLGGRFRTNDRYFKEIAHGLSPLRDATVLTQTLEKLARHPDAALATLATAVRPILPATHKTSDKKAEKAIMAASRALDKGKKRIEKWPELVQRYRTIGGGLKSVYLQAQHHQQQLDAEPGAALWHDWRRWVKYHGYQLKLLQPLNPEFLTERSVRVKTLGEWLGDDHDLWVLAALIEQHVDRLDPAVVQLMPVITEQRQLLQHQALDSGRQLFAEDSQAFGKRIKGFWQSW